MALLPFFGGITEASSNQWLLRVSVPWDQWTKQDDVNIKTAWKTSNAVVGNEETLYSTLNLINDYLWWSFWAIAMGLTIYAGYEVITWDGDKKAMKKAQWTLIGVAVGLCIAMLSSAIIKIVVNIIERSHYSILIKKTNSQTSELVFSIFTIFIFWYG